MRQVWEINVRFDVHLTSASFRSDSAILKFSDNLVSIPVTLALSVPGGDSSRVHKILSTPK